MQIGTPLGKNSLKIMLLGSGELGKEVLIALQRLGVETIAVDRYANAPGQQVAHRSAVIDMTNPKELRDLILQERPHIIVPEIEAIATEVLLEIEQEDIAEVIPVARATQLTMNREGIRRLAAESLDLPTSRYAFADNTDHLRIAIDADIAYPCIIKPVMSSSGKGQSLITNSEQLEQAWQHAMHSGRVKQSRVIVEEKIDFDYEITLLTVRALNLEGQMDTFFCEPIGHRQIDGDYVESWQPQTMSSIALKKARNIAQSITFHLGGRGIFGVELFVKGDHVWFSEVSPRPHDTGMVTMVTQMQSEFELHARAILNLPVDTTLQHHGASAVIYGGMDEKDIVYNHVAAALTVPQSALRLFGKPEAYTKRRMGVALAYGDNIDDCRERAKKVASTITTDKP
ncbi:MAG: formate-dependent phosphoribosylglycinamide formyltransferase [Thiohalomonadales bacterium]